MFHAKKKEKKRSSQHEIYLKKIVHSIQKSQGKKSPSNAKIILCLLLFLTKRDNEKSLTDHMILDGILATDKPSSADIRSSSSWDRRLLLIGTARRRYRASSG